MGVETRFSRCAQSLSTPFSLQQLNFFEQRELIRKACELRSEFWGMQQNNKTQSGLGGEKDDLLNPKIGHKAAQAALNSSVVAYRDIGVRKQRRSEEEEIKCIAKLL